MTSTHASARSRRSRRFLLPLAVVLLAAAVTLGVALVPSGTAAQAVTVSCGQTITTSTTVANDLTNCPGDGLVIGAAGITLNLNGHTIDGSFAEVGIRNDSFPNVTISNGTVNGFSDGIELGDAAAGNHVQDMRVSANVTQGIHATGPDTSITSTAAFDNGSFGIRIGGERSQVDDSTAKNNDTFGIVSDGDNTIISDSLALSNDAAGIALSAAADGAQLTGNIANANFDGINVGVLNATLSKNSASFNTQRGINALSGGITDAGGNVAKGNGNVHQCENVLCPAS